MAEQEAQLPSKEEIAKLPRWAQGKKRDRSSLFPRKNMFVPTYLHAWWPEELNL